jgi:hypothetical protein
LQYGTFHRNFFLVLEFVLILARKNISIMVSWQCKVLSQTQLRTFGGDRLKNVTAKDGLNLK